MAPLGRPGKFAHANQYGTAGAQVSSFTWRAKFLALLAKSAAAAAAAQPHCTCAPQARTIWKQFSPAAATYPDQRPTGPRFPFLFLSLVFFSFFFFFFFFSFSLPANLLPHPRLWPSPLRASAPDAAKSRPAVNASLGPRKISALSGGALAIACYLFLLLLLLLQRPQTRAAPAAFLSRFSPARQAVFVLQRPRGAQAAAAPWRRPNLCLLFVFLLSSCRFSNFQKLLLARRPLHPQTRTFCSPAGLDHCSSARAPASPISSQTQLARRLSAKVSPQLLLPLASCFPIGQKVSLGPTLSGCQRWTSKVR